MKSSVLPSPTVKPVPGRLFTAKFAVSQFDRSLGRRFVLVALLARRAAVYDQVFFALVYYAQFRLISAWLARSNKNYFHSVEVCLDTLLEACIADYGLLNSVSASWVNGWLIMTLDPYFVQS